jgi:uncharacterized protein (TIGR03083 family)
MSDLADVYEETRASIKRLVADLDDEELSREVPATPAWTIRDVIAHLTGDAVCLLAGDFPREFFEAMGSEQGVLTLDAWTDKQVVERRGKPLHEILDEWDQAAPKVVQMMRTSEWPEGVLPFAAHILLADIATHQQDIYGALGLDRDRDSAQVRIGVATFIGGVGLRLQMAGAVPLRFIMESKEVVAGGGETQTSVEATRFEFFRALSGRRNPEQIKALRWTGDPEPYIPYFYPYGIRQDALTE